VNIECSTAMEQYAVVQSGSPYITGIAYSAYSADRGQMGR